MRLHVGARGALSLLVAAWLLAAAPAARAQKAGGAPSKDSAEQSVEDLERTAVAAVNAERKALGLPPLVLSEDLCRLARAYSRDMVERRFFDHVDPDGGSVMNRTDRAGITRWLNLGENIARNRGFKDPADVAVREWMKSDGHRGNILDDRFNETGVGVWVAPDRTVYFTQIFLARSPESTKK